MWTNVFRIGDLHLASWFQFIPTETDSSVLAEKSSKSERNDAANNIVLSAHIQLQDEGLLSSWTNNFVGPWDPSQGEHNPDEKLKLWLFFPGRHSTILETAQAAVSRLRVVASGIWSAPGESEEVTTALSQALRNSLERALRGLFYVRFGDVFIRCHPSSSYDSAIRKGILTFEFVFAATDEAIYVLIIVSAKYVRLLCGDDIEKVLVRSSHLVGEGLPVIVAPHGMLGRLTGCCPSDLVKQVYISKSTQFGKSSTGLPYLAQSPGCLLRGQRYHVEVTFGCPSTSTDKYSCKSVNELHSTKDSSILNDGIRGHTSVDHLPVLERTFIYPPEAVVVPMIHRAYSRFSNKRLWLQNYSEKTLWETWPFWNFSALSYFEHCFLVESSRGFGIDSYIRGLLKPHNGNSNSICSSLSSVNSTSCDSDNAAAGEGGEFDGDADSLAGKHSSMPSNDSVHNGGRKMVLKRPRGDMADVVSQDGGAAQDALNSVAIQSSLLSWEDDDVGIDINILLSEFGDFGDFFENGVLNFGEPPGTAESHALVLTSVDCEVTSSPCAAMDFPDPILSPDGATSFERLSQQTMVPTEDAGASTGETFKDTASPAKSQSVIVSSGKFEFLTKVEAVMTFAPEYAAVELPGSECSTSLFLNPYMPRMKQTGSLNAPSGTYAYECKSSTDKALEDKAEKFVKIKPSDPSKSYTFVQNSAKDADTKDIVSAVRQHQSSPAFSVLTSLSSSLTLQKNGNMSDAGYFLLSMKTTLATEVECVMFQAAMCRVRHTLLSLKSKTPLGLNSSVSNIMLNEICVKPDTMAMRYNAVKKESIPVRIAGDTDVEKYDGPSLVPLNVWRSIEAPANQKPISQDPGNFSSSVKPMSIETLHSFTQRQSLFDLLSAIPFLVQQAVSFVDVALDTEDGDGPYCWLALQEQRRRGFPCDPSMVHAGCGGFLATCHSLDTAGNNLVDPLAADISASLMISLLQSDMKSALKSAFANVDGPLSILDWCRGRNNLAESSFALDGSILSYGEGREQSNTYTLGSDSMSPSQSTGTSSSNRDSVRIDDLHRRQSQDSASEPESKKSHMRSRPTLAVLPLPAILVGYQDDWLKTSSDGLKEWEKAPLEPYASSKAVTYCVLCPNVDILSSAAVDFFQQLETVYEACKLGTHTPLSAGGHIEASAGRNLLSGLILVECPEQLKVGSTQFNGISPLNAYIQALSKHWSVKGFITSLLKILKDLKFISCISANQKESNAAPCNVIYVVCPFPDPSAVLQTLLECCNALGYAASLSEKERKSLLHAQVAKALNCIAADEMSASNVIMLSGFSISKLVLQIVTVETLLKINKPMNQLAVLKDIAFTVYNKVRRIPRNVSSNDMLHSSAFLGRSQPTSMHSSASHPTLWKDCLVPRMSGSSLTRDSEYENTLRSVSWDNSWSSARGSGLSDATKFSELCIQDDRRYSFEPVFILAEPGSTDCNVGSELSSSKIAVDDSFTSHAQASTSGSASEAGNCPLDASENEKAAASLHCSYGWTEDWRWLVCIWTDSRGELLDSLIFPFGGISSRQDTKLLQSLFVQVLQHGCQVISSLDSSFTRPRDIIISRAGSFFELEAQEWQKAIHSFGGNEVKKWPVQLRRATPEGISSNANGPVLQQQEMGLMQERNLPPLPGPSLYNPHSKSAYMKGVMQSGAKKQHLVGQSALDHSRGSLQLVQSITLVAVSLDHSLHLILQSDLVPGGASQGGSGISAFLEGFIPVKPVQSSSAAFLFIPSPSFRYLTPNSLQLPACLTSESPPLAHLLQSKGSASPLATGYVVSKSVMPMRRDITEPSNGDWPSVLAVSLIDHYGFGSAGMQEAIARGISSGSGVGKQARTHVQDGVGRGYESEKQDVLESVAAELHALSYMTMSPVYIDRRSALPFHCDMVLRLRTLLHYADKELSRPPENQ